MTTNVLDITRIEINSLSLYKEIVDLRRSLLEHMMEYEKQIMNNIGDSCKHPLTKREKCKTRLDFAQLGKNGGFDSFLAEVDRSRMSQVVSNLLDNAFKFTNENEEILIEIKKEFINGQKHAIITMKDTGGGIHEEILPSYLPNLPPNQTKELALAYLFQEIS